MLSKSYKRVAIFFLTEFFIKKYVEASKAFTWC